MKKLLVVALVLVGAVLAAAPQQAEAGRRERANRWSARFAQTMPWHGNYYHTAYGQPVALVVPPTAAMQTHFNWGVAKNQMVPIYHQFSRVHPGASGGEIIEGGAFQPTPIWPSSTQQFGVYYIRGPW